MKTKEQLQQEVVDARKAYDDFSQVNKNPARYSGTWQTLQRLFRAVSKTRNALDKFNLVQARKELGMDIVEKMLRKQFLLKTSRPQTTAIKGWYDHSHGYKIHGVDTIEFVGHMPKFDEIVSAMSTTYNVTVEYPVSSYRDTRGSIKIISRKA